MSISSIPTLMSLDEFSEMMEVSPWLFNQLDAGAFGGLTDYKPWMQFEHQTASTLSRQTVAEIIASAEEMLEKELEYWPAPKATVGEEIPYPKPFDPEWRNDWYNNKGLLKDVRLRHGHVSAMGVYAYTVLETNTPISFIDTDDDGKTDFFTTAAIPTTLTDESEILALFIDSDRLRLDGPEETWQIRPVIVDIQGGFVTVSGPKWLVVKPNKQFRPVPGVLDPTDPLNYVTEIKLTRKYVDDTQQGSLIFERFPCPTDEDPCAQIEKAVCFAPRDKRHGIVIPTLLENPECPPGYAPDRIRVNYISGYPLKKDGFGRMDTLHAQMVGRLACTVLGDRSGVSNSENKIDYWRSYPTAGKGDRETIFISPGTANNPFGLRRGAVWAWSIVMQLNESKLAGAVS